MTPDQIPITHPDKVLFPDCGLTKRDLADYYERIADRLLPRVAERPLTLRCFPEGIDAEGFFNKNAPDHFPDFIERIEVPTRAPGKEPARMSSAGKPADLVYFAGQNAIEIHAASARRGDLEKPDQIIFDFDPSDGDFSKVREVAIGFEELLESSPVDLFWKTTGSEGLHAHIPLEPKAGFDAAKSWARNLAERLRQRMPALATLEQRKDKRGNKVFIDYLRNAYGQTTIAPYAVRARKNAPVATPIRIDELRDGSLGPDSYSVGNIFRRLAQIEDPWKAFDQKRLESLMPFR